MTPAQSFPALPIFCTAGNKVAIDSTTLSIGYQPQQQLPCEYYNQLENVETTMLNTLVSGLTNITAELDLVVTSGGGTPSLAQTNQVISSLNILFAASGINWQTALKNNLGSIWPSNFAWDGSGVVNYDLVIDSNSKLDMWCSANAGQYHRVLVRSGLWTPTNIGVVTSGVMIDLDKAGTSYVFAEKGSSINYSGSYAGNMYGLYHAVAPTDMSVERFDNVKINITNTNGNGYGFFGCTNLTNCTGTGTAGSGIGLGFSNCTNLINCTGTATGNGYGFSGCTNLANCTGTGSGSSGNGYGFSSCTNLTNCTGTGTSGGGNTGFGFYGCTGVVLCAGQGLSTSSTGYGFSGCHKISLCKSSGASKTSTFLNNQNYVDAATAVPIPSSGCDTAAYGWNTP